MAIFIDCPKMWPNTLTKGLIFSFCFIHGPQILILSILFTPYLSPISVTRLGDNFENWPRRCPRNSVVEFVVPRWNSVGDVTLYTPGKNNYILLQNMIGYSRRKYSLCTPQQDVFGMVAAPDSVPGIPKIKVYKWICTYSSNIFDKWTSHILPVKKSTILCMRKTF